jgi:hypothetical protein
MIRGVASNVFDPAIKVAVKAPRAVGAERDGVLLMAHLKVRPTKIRVKGVPPSRKRRMGHLKVQRIET